MKNSQENKLSMYYAVIEACKKHISNLQNLPAFLAAFNAFLAIVQKISDSIRTSELQIKGITVEKNKLKEEAAFKTEFVANAVFAYAQSIGDSTLKENVKYGRSSLFFVRDTICLERCQLVLSIATTHIANLADFGVTPNTLQVLANVLQKYEDILSKPREASSERKNAFNQMTQQFNEADDVLKNIMDKLASSYTLTDSSFFNKYTSARNIIEHGKKISSFTGIIRDKATGLAIRDAAIRIEITSSTGEKSTFSVKSSEHGVFKIKNTPEGICTATFTKLGYKEGIEKSDIRRGKITRVEIALEKDSTG